MGDPSGAGAPDVCQEATWQRHPRKDWLLHSSEAAKSISRGGGNSNVYMKDLQIKTGSSTILPQCSPEPWENQSTIMGKQNKAALLDIQKWRDQKNPTYKWSSEYLVYKSQVSISAVVLVQDFMPHSREENKLPTTSFLYMFTFWDKFYRNSVCSLVFTNPAVCVRCISSLALLWELPIWWFLTEPRA